MVKFYKLDGPWAIGGGQSQASPTKGKGKQSESRSKIPSGMTSPERNRLNDKINEGIRPRFKNSGDKLSIGTYDLQIPPSGNRSPTKGSQGNRKQSDSPNFSEPRDKKPSIFNNQIFESVMIDDPASPAKPNIGPQNVTGIKPSKFDPNSPIQENQPEMNSPAKVNIGPQNKYNSGNDSRSPMNNDNDQGGRYNTEGYPENMQGKAENL